MAGIAKELKKKDVRGVCVEMAGWFEPYEDGDLSSELCAIETTLFGFDASISVDALCCATVGGWGGDSEDMQSIGFMVQAQIEIPALDVLSIKYTKQWEDDICDGEPRELVGRMLLELREQMSEPDWKAKRLAIFEERELGESVADAVSCGAGSRL